ncbi:MAG TPA: type 4a pilus biogenesis protein PilO [candidate division Zixibacteria bacterium]
MQSNRLIDFLLNYRRMLILVSGIVVVLVLFLVVDLPLAKLFFEKIHRTYQMSKQYSSLETLDKGIQQEKDLNSEIMKTVSHLQSRKITRNRLAPAIELFNQSAVDSKVSLISVNSSSAIEEENYVKVPFEIELEGEYHHIANFINKIENSSHPLRIESLDISTRDYISYSLDASLKATLYLVRE